MQFSTPPRTTLSGAGAGAAWSLWTRTRRWQSMGCRPAPSSLRPRSSRASAPPPCRRAGGGRPPPSRCGGGAWAQRGQRRWRSRRSASSRSIGSTCMVSASTTKAVLSRRQRSACQMGHAGRFSTFARGTRWYLGMNPGNKLQSQQSWLHGRIFGVWRTLLRLPFHMQSCTRRRTTRSGAGASKRWFPYAQTGQWRNTNWHLIFSVLVRSLKMSICRASVCQTCGGCRNRWWRSSFTLGAWKAAMAVARSRRSR
mmetsp:Transcript_77278/g.226639  ORF Transcript_77278/g.226639 Transcript_77278/m.226639 type:complete len:254 (-) Transcript_77278:1596-2357(-)